MHHLISNLLKQNVGYTQRQSIPRVLKGALPQNATRCSSLDDSVKMYKMLLRH